MVTVSTGDNHVELEMTATVAEWNNWTGLVLQRVTFQMFSYIRYFSTKSYQTKSDFTLNVCFIAYTFNFSFISSLNISILLLWVNETVKVQFNEGFSEGAVFVYVLMSVCVFILWLTGSHCEHIFFLLLTRSHDNSDITVPFSCPVLWGIWGGAVWWVLTEGLGVLAASVGVSGGRAGYIGFSGQYGGGLLSSCWNPLLL